MQLYKINNYKVIAKNFYRERNIIKTLEFYNKAYNTPMGSKDVELLLDMALVYDELEEYEKAEKKYKEILKVNPKDSRAFYGLAIIYDNKEEYKKAIKLYEKAIEYDKNYNRAYFF